MAAPALRRLFEPLTIANFTVRNRIVNPTHGTGLGEARDLRYLQERARGGAALLGVHSSVGIFDYAIGAGPRTATPEWDELALSPVTREGIAHYDDLMVPWMRRRSDVVHAEGAACFAQVYHPGAGRHQAGAGPALAPSAVPDPYEAQVPHTLRDDEIEELVLAFAHGIRRGAGGRDGCGRDPRRGRLPGQRVLLAVVQPSRRSLGWQPGEPGAVRAGDHRRGADDGGPRLPDRDPCRCRGRRAAPRTRSRRARRGVSAHRAPRCLRQRQRRELCGFRRRHRAGIRQPVVHRTGIQRRGRGRGEAGGRRARLRHRTHHRRVPGGEHSRGRRGRHGRHGACAHRRPRASEQGTRGTRRRDPRVPRPLRVPRGRAPSRTGDVRRERRSRTRSRDGDHTGSGAEVRGGRGRRPGRHGSRGVSRRCAAITCISSTPATPSAVRRRSSPSIPTVATCATTPPTSRPSSAGWASRSCSATRSAWRS